MSRTTIEQHPDAVTLIVRALAEQGWGPSGLRDRIRIVEVRPKTITFMVCDRNGTPFILGCCIDGHIDESDAAMKHLIGRPNDPNLLAVFSTKGGLSHVLRYNPSSKKTSIETQLEPWALPPNTVPLDVNGRGHQRSLRPLEHRVEDLLFQVHSHMRDIDGLHAPEAVDELCKLIFLKAYDERTTPIGEPVRLQKPLYGSADEYAGAVRGLYRKALAAEEVRTGVSEGSLSDVWGSLNISDSSLIRCIDQLGPYSLSSTALDVKGRAFQNVVAPTVRAGMGQYFTPEQVGHLMVEALGPQPGERVIDPFAGSAHFLTIVSNRFSRDSSSNASAVGEPACELFGIEKSDRMLRVAWTDLMLHEVVRVNLAHGDALGHQSQFPTHAFGTFDVVVTNPPFGSVLREDTISTLGVYQTAGKTTTPVEVLALERAVAFLRPGGRIAIILPDGILGNQRTLPVRRWLSERLALRCIVSLPQETFVPFGASVKASILFGRRLTPGERPATNAKVLLVKMDNVGHDTTGRRTDETDIGRAIDAIRVFIESEGW